LEAFIREAIDTVKMLEADPYRTLPAPERQAKDAVTGLELGLYDPAYESLTAETRRQMALSSMAWAKPRPEASWKLISEEGEYSDSVFDSLTLDSQGLEARHTETSFEIGYESTIEDAEGRHFSSYWWDATPRLQDLQLKDCAEKACQRAVDQLNPSTVPSGKYTLILDTECASKVVTPILSALGGYSLQQKNSFLMDSLGKQLFPQGLTILDAPRTPGDTGCRLFDSEGVATREMPIIENGIVKTYFLNTYISGKMEMEPTVEDATRVKVMPLGGCKTQQDVLSQVKDGILVTGFNGGNSNPATGNFSYGIEGFVIKDGKRVHPVREMLITGDFLTLWSHLIAAAQDARPCLSKLVPTLAFTDVDFSA
jgi:PmbA protein